MKAPGAPKKSQLELKGEASAATQRLRDMRREERRKVAVRTRQAGRLSLLGAPEGGRSVADMYNAKQFVGGGPQPAAGIGVGTGY